MKKLIAGTFLLLLFGISVSSQTTDKSVESINKRYTEIAAKAEACETDDDQCEFGELFMNTLSINSRDHQWRALGIYGKTFKFFYKTVENDERRLYPDQLVFVEVERKESNRNYIEEYLYTESGLLMLYRQKAENDDQAPVERRVYFSGVKAIRIVEDTKTRDRLGPKDVATVKDVTAQSGKIKEIFAKSIKL